MKFVSRVTVSFKNAAQGDEKEKEQTHGVGEAPRGDSCDGDATL